MKDDRRQMSDDGPVGGYLLFLGGKGMAVDGKRAPRAKAPAFARRATAGKRGYGKENVQRSTQIYSLLTSAATGKSEQRTEDGRASALGSTRL